VSGSGAKKRQQAASRRAAALRRDGLPLSRIAELTGIPKEQVAGRIQLGERLLSLESQP